MLLLPALVSARPPPDELADELPSAPPGAAPLPASPPPGPTTDETLLREYEALEAKEVSGAEYDRFIADHPRLLQASAKPYGPALMWALEFERTAAALALLRAGAAIPSAALALAARGGLDCLVKELSARGARDDSEGSALRAAAEYGHASTLRLLLDRGTHVGAQSPKDGCTALHLAVIGRYVEAVRVLLAARAPLEARDQQGRTPLAWGPYAYAPKPKHIYRHLGAPHDTVFVDVGEPTAMKLLLAGGARVDTVDKEGNTPLHEAALHGSLRAAAVLLAHGAPVQAKNHQGETPLSIAKTRGNDELLQLFKKK